MPHKIPLSPCQLRVRSSDLDAYGHVNHAVYLNYYEQARLEALATQGLSFRSLWNQSFLFVIARAEVDYLAPLDESQQIEITSKITAWGKSSVTLVQEIFQLPERDKVSRGRFVMVFLDRDTRMPVSIPSVFLKAFMLKRS